MHDHLERLYADTEKRKPPFIDVSAGFLKAVRLDQDRFSGEIMRISPLTEVAVFQDGEYDGYLDGVILAIKF